MDSETSESGKILRQLKMYLDKHRLKEIEEFMDDNIYNEIEQDIELKFDIMILICQRLRSLNKYRFKTFECCQNLLIEIAQRCNAKEMLLAFLTELENGTFEQESNCSSQEDDEQEESSPKKICKSSFDNCIKSLFTPLKIVINRIPNQKETNLKWVLGILNCHLFKITIKSATNHQTEIEQQSSLVAETLNCKQFTELNQLSLQRFDFLLPDYLNFLSEFVDQYANENFKRISTKYLNGKLILIKALLSILYHPLMHLDLSQSDQQTNQQQQQNNNSTTTTVTTTVTATSKFKQTTDFDKDIIGLTSTKDNLLSELNGVKCFKHNSQIYSFQIVNLISRLEPNIFDLYELEQLICKQDENTSLKLTEELVKYSFGVQAYICYVLLDENLNFVPLIYSPIFIFQQHIQYVIPLLDRTESFVCEKGLRLIEKLIFKVPNLSLKSNFIDFLRECPLDKVIIKVMRFAANEQHRRTAFNVYKKLISILDYKGRYNFLFKTTAEPNQFNGIRGLMITIYKDFLFDKENNLEFIDSNLLNFLRLTIDQANLVQEEFDLIENMDSLMSFLNFLRFLFIWDKQSNQTGVFNELKEIKQFLNRLKKKIEFGRNFLKMKISSAENDSKNAKKKQDKILFDINCVNGDENLTDLFNSMSEKDEIKMYEQGLANVDMMDSVLSRVNELISNCK